ncbi:flagellar brake protein [Rhodocyclus tenuis]|uniref:Flagellar brake protein YcgR n=2 Tax=Rhodocyclus TaxID=1064 RepID=A0A6L5JX30_RHOTE|nr:flagellar brake protein [Rhodocyclus gracilis]MQY51581.1 flagellar brake protein [Rhodocyclus gracilis]NJA89159.1 flagellar brake protein [Rhodocyclus gracilis]
MAETDVPDAPEQPAPRFELEQSNDYSRFLLRSRSEILFVLRSLIQKTAMITVYFDQGQSFLLTTILSLTPDNDGIIFDIASDDEVNRKALAANKLIFITAIDRVKVQFKLKGLKATQFEGRPAFRGELPEDVLRLQRREYFRLSTPVANPVKCHIPMRRPDGTAMTIDLPLIDISAGGVGLMLTPTQRDLFPVGEVLADCRMTLPDEGILTASLGVRNAFDVTTRTGSQYVRLGCEFIDLPGSRMSMVQRYITRIERERKARLSGMS